MESYGGATALDEAANRSRRPSHIGPDDQPDRPSLFSFMLDPDIAKFERSLRESDLRRTVQREVRQCPRMAGPSYVGTLNGAPAREGLADRYVSRLFDTLPEPWECTFPNEIIETHLSNRVMLVTSGNDHRA